MDVESSEVAVVYVVHSRLGIAAGSSLLPAGIHSSGRAGSEEVNCREPVEFFKVFGSTFAFEGLQHDQVLTMLKSGVLDVFDGLEEGGGLSLDVPLLFSFVP